MNETTVGREPVQIVEIDQPACALRYGVSPCTAVVGQTGSRKCFNTRITCQDPKHYSPSFVITWRFARPQAVLPRDIYAESEGASIKTHPIPSLLSVSTTPTKINVGGGKASASPLGTRATVSIAIADHIWDDSVGDFYVDERPYTPIERGTFWSKWLARNPYHTRYLVRVREGYAGQSIDEMQTRLYILDRVDGPTGDRVVLTAKDPLRLADDKRTQFPRVSEIELVDAISAEQTNGIRVLCAQRELTAAFGNTGKTRYLRIGDEIIEYASHSPEGQNEWELTGVSRGALGTVAGEHDAGDKCQRVGRYSGLAVWGIARDLLLNHTSIDPDYIDGFQWRKEGYSFLSPFILSATVAEPTAVVKLLGELTEQVPFYMWWDERRQTIMLRAVRPPMWDAVGQLNENSHIIRDSAALKEDAGQRVSRVFLYYQQKDPTKSLNDIGNYRSVRARIDADAESDNEYGDVQIRQIFSRWLTTSAQAIQTTVRLLARFRNAVQTLSVKVDAKDRSISTADVIDVNTRVVVDETGAAIPSRWQVIAAEEIVPGEVVRFDMQRFEFLGRFWLWADESAPDYSDATEEERNTNAYWSDADGSLGGGELGYQWM